MSFHTAKFSPAYNLFNTPCRQETEGEKSKHCDRIKMVLSENSLIRCNIPKGSVSLIRSIGFALAMPEKQCETMYGSFVTLLKRLTTEHELPLRLGYIASNPSFIKDYSDTPTLPGFDKITIELASLLYKRQIVIYTVSEDLFLNAVIINSNFTETIQLLKSSGNHYEPVFSIEDFKALQARIQLEKSISEAHQRIGDGRQDTDGKHGIHRAKSFETGQNEDDPHSDSTGEKKGDTDMTDTKPDLHFLEDESRSARYDDNSSGVFDMRTSCPPNFINARIYSAQKRHPAMEHLEPNPLLPPPAGTQTPHTVANWLADPTIWRATPAAGQQPANGVNDDNSPEKRKPIILGETKERYTGYLKFFDENKDYGFIVTDEDGSDIFVHWDDLMKANISKEYLRTAKQGNLIRMSFACMSYIGKYHQSRKAVNIQLLYDY